MNLKQNILNKNYSPAPDCSGSPEVIKVIFFRHSKATAGSSCNGFRKKTLRTRAIAQSWNRLKKNKTVGKDYAYSIKAPIVSYSLLPLLEPPPAGPFDKSCKWEVHVLEHGKWRKTKENDKTGETVHYTFTQKSLSRKGIKIVVQKGNQKTEELVKPKKATEPKIVKVELLDSNSKKPSKPLSYGQTVIVKVHCTEHEYGMVNVTLWEDDAVGKGHNKINEKNFAQTKQAEVKRGIAETKFVLSPSFAKMAEAHKAKGSSSEGTMHEYYVTATIKDKKDASNNIEVNVPPEKPVPPLKKRVPVQTPTTPHAPLLPIQKKPVVPAKPATPAVPATPSTTPGITNVVLTKTSATTLHAAIYHNKLHGKKIRFKLMEDDGGKLVDDELINEIYTLPRDTNYLYIAINLKAIPVSKGDDLLEGKQQELFVDVEVLETHKQTKTGTLNVNSTAFKPDPVDTTNKVVKIWESIFGGDEKEKKKEKSDCPNCLEDFKYDDIVKIFPAASKNKDLAEKLVKEINKLKEKYKINSCIRKAHLINQFGSETGFNTLIEGIDGYSVSTLKSLFGYFKRNPNEAETYKGNLHEIAIRAYGLRKVDKESDIVACNIKPGAKCNDLGNETMEDGYTYIGRGLIQLTGKYNYSEINKDFKKAFPNKGDLVKKPELLENPEYATMSAYSYWINNNINAKADLGSNGSHVDAITKIINKNLDVSHYKKRRDSFVKAKEVLRLAECKNLKNETATDSVTIRLIRKWQTTNSTTGEFTIDNSEVKGYILEEKGPDTTVSGIEQRVPIGTYNLVWHNGTKFKNVLKLYNSEVSIDRAILIHPGNNAASTEGCLLPGTSRSTDWVSGSRDKLKEIIDFVTSVGIENAKIIITESYV